MIYSQTPEFIKDVKVLAKRWRSIPDDVEVVKTYIAPLYDSLSEDTEVQIYRNAMFASKRAAVLVSNEQVEVVKMRLDLKALGTNSKVRIVFVAVKTNDEIIFVELYSKNDKSRENPTRYRQFVS